MNAKEFLAQVKKLDCMIENKRVERERWLMLAVNTTAGAAPDTGVRVQSSGNKQRMEDAVIRSVDIKAEITKTIGKLFEARQQIISVIEQLPTEEYNLLYKVYIGEAATDQNGRQRIVYKSLRDVADECDKSHSWAKGIHRSAIKNVQKILDGREN